MSRQGDFEHRHEASNIAGWPSIRDGGRSVDELVNDVCEFEGLESDVIMARSMDND